jgi:hypothetical protein
VNRFQGMLSSFTVSPYSRQQWSGYGAMGSNASAAATYGSQFAQNLGGLSSGPLTVTESFTEDMRVASSDANILDAHRPAGYTYIRNPANVGGASGTGGTGSTAGAAGAAGATGPTGPTGAGGAAGAAGAAGGTGPTGTSGAAGTAGTAGAAGATGPTGPTGVFDSSKVTGPLRISNRWTISDEGPALVFRDTEGPGDNRYAMFPNTSNRDL